MCYGDDTQKTDVLRYGHERKGQGGHLHLHKILPFLMTVVGPKTAFPCDISVLWTAVGREGTPGMGSCIAPIFLKKFQKCETLNNLSGIVESDYYLCKTFKEKFG